jgi:hypothetical protein
MTSHRLVLLGGRGGSPSWVQLCTPHLLLGGTWSSHASQSWQASPPDRAPQRKGSGPCFTFGHGQRSLQGRSLLQRVPRTASSFSLLPPGSLGAAACRAPPSCRACRRHGGVIGAAGFGVWPARDGASFPVTATVCPVPHHRSCAVSADAMIIRGTNGCVYVQGEVRVWPPWARSDARTQNK